MNLFNGDFGSTTPDKLFADTLHPVDIKGVSLKSGQGVLLRGTVLGIILLVAGTPAAGSNTGGGTVTSVSLGSGAKIGTYTLKCTAAATNAGTFKVIGPDGQRYDDATVGVAYTAGPVHFTINDGGTDFAVNDSFTIAVTAGSGLAVKVNSANKDGSGLADCILTDSVDTTDGDVAVTAYSSGTFNRQALIFGGTDDAADHEARLREQGIYLKDVQAYE